MIHKRKIHIGSLIKARVEERGLTISSFASLLHYERTNIYKIFKRSSIDIELLLRISEILEYDFIREVYLKEEGVETEDKRTITLEINKEKLESLHELLKQIGGCD